MRSIKYFLICCAVMLFCISCGKSSSAVVPNKKIMYVNAGARVNTLDPALADDLMSQYMTASFYDTLLQYDYTARPYKLEPSMLKRMPEVSADMKDFSFELRDDLYFQDGAAFKGQGREARKIRSSDIAFSFMRLADARLHSPGYWIFRGKIEGLDDFAAASASAEGCDYSIYDKPCRGIEIIDDRHFKIRLTKPDPRFLYLLAMPYASIVSRTALEFYKDKFQEHPQGSGPFKLRRWVRDYVIELDRNSEYRDEFFEHAENSEERKTKLPLLDGIVCYLVSQPISSWLMFLQGELDSSSLDKDHFDAVVGADQKLIPALAERGIKMERIPEFQINYVAFSFSDPLLGKNSDLRKAISLAYNVNERVELFNYCIIPANGPLPPGVPGYDDKFVNPYAKYDIEKAMEYLKKAGFPGGINPGTGQPLEFSFDVMGNSTQHRQLAELMAADMKKIGINIKPSLNNKSRFLQKAENGQLQLFRLNWVGDYPDAENFLQLFYSANAGACNRSFFRDAKFDEMYRKILSMPDSSERTAAYSQMVSYLTEQCPWIFESFPVSFQLIHSWLQNYKAHDFAFSRWKYLSVNTEERFKAKKSFRPLDMQSLRREN